MKFRLDFHLTLLTKDFGCQQARGQGGLGDHHAFGGGEVRSHTDSDQTSFVDQGMTRMNLGSNWVGQGEKVSNFGLESGLGLIAQDGPDQFSPLRSPSS